MILFSEVMDDLYKWVNPKTRKASPMISEDIYKIIMNNAEVLKNIRYSINVITMSGPNR